MRRSRSVARRVSRRTAKAQRSRKVSRKRRSRNASRLRTAKRVAKRVSKVARRSNRRSSRRSIRRRVNRRSSKMRGGGEVEKFITSMFEGMKSHKLTPSEVHKEIAQKAKEIVEEKNNYDNVGELTILITNRINAELTAGHHKSLSENFVDEDLFLDINEAHGEGDEGDEGDKQTGEVTADPDEEDEF